MKRRGLLARALAGITALPVLQRVEAKAMPGQVVVTNAKLEPVENYEPLKLTELVALYVRAAGYPVENLDITFGEYRPSPDCVNYLIAMDYKGQELITSIVSNTWPRGDLHKMLGLYVVNGLKNEQYYNARWGANNG